MSFFRCCALILFLLVSIGCSDESPTVQEPQTTTVQPDNSVTPGSAQKTDPLNVLDISEREYGDINAIAVLLNVPLQPDQPFDKLISIEPQLPTPVLSEDGRTLYLTGIEPLQEYNIQVSSNLEAANGTKLGDVIQKQVKTRDLPELVSFEADGIVMIPGKVDSLALVAVNVDEADVNIYKVHDNRIVQFFDQYSSLKTGDRWYFDEGKFEDTFDHVYASRVKIDTARNKRNKAAFSIKQVPSVNAGGIFLATVRSPGGLKYETTWFSVSNIGVQLRSYQKNSHFIIQNAATGELLQNVELEILDYQNKTIAMGQTDAKGTWSIDNNWQRQSPRLIIAKNAGHVSVLKYHAPNYDLSKFSVSGRQDQDVDHLVYSPRDIYRPGEEVILSTLLRDRDGQLVNGPLNLELYKPDGQRVGEWRLEQLKPGYYEFRHRLSSNAMLGPWYAQVYSPAKKRFKSYFPFKVEEFLPERMRLLFPGTTDEVLSFSAGEEIKIPVKGEYLYGAPAAGNRLDTQVSISGWANPFPHLGEFRFGDPEQINWDQFSLPGVDLNAAGENFTEINKQHYDWQHFSTPVKMTLGYSLFETGGRAINRSRPVLLWPKASFIGIKPLFADDQSAVNNQVSFELLRTDKEGAVLASGEAKATLYRLEEKYFWSHTPERGWHYQIEKSEYPVANELVTFSNADPVSLALPVEWGKYRLELDDYTSASKTVYRFHAGEPWYYHWNTAADQIRPDKVTIAFDKKSYKAGDKAQIKLVSPTQGIAIVLLETDHVLQTHEVVLTDKQATLEISVPENLARHDAYISAFVVAPTAQQDKIKKRSFGIKHLPLDRSSRSLDVSINVDEKLTPETTADVLVSVFDSEGKPVSGDYFVGLTAVDSGVLSVTGYEQPDPFKYFYAQRAYSGRISDMYDDLAEPTLYDTAEIRWGGDAELERGGEKPPAEVQIVSLFASPVQVDNGKARIPLTLPAFDGELTLNAIAMGGSHLGADKKEAKVASPVVAQLAMPRFLALNDLANLSLDLTNLSGEKQDVQVHLASANALKPWMKDYRLTLEDGEKQVLSLDVEAIAVGSGMIRAEILLSANTGKQISVQREWTLGVRAAYPSEYERVTTVLTQGQEAVFPSTRLKALTENSIAAQLRIARTPDLDAQSHFKSLLQYPYGCLEQTTSKSQPLSLLYGNPDVPFAPEISAVKIDKYIQAAIDRYAELQLVSGGFGLWDKFSPEEHWLSVYATEFLLELERSGFNIPEEMLNSARARLRNYVVSRRALMVRTWSDIPSHYEISYKAYASYVLAKQGAINLGPLRDLSENLLHNARGSLPGVQLGTAMLLTGSVEEGVKLISAALEQRRAKGYLGDYGSEIRDLALTTAYILTTPGMPARIIDKALQQLPELLVQLKQKRWLSTQEKAALLKLALALHEDTTASQWEGILSKISGDLLLSASGELGRNLETSDLVDMTFTNSVEQPLFASFSWTGIRKEMPEASNEGIELNVEQYLVENGAAEALKPDQLLTIGDVVLTRVRFYSDERVPDGLLVNLIPAGLELENQNLQHSLKLESIRLEGEAIQQQARIVYQAYEDDRYVAAVDIPAKREQTLYFLSRAVTPGRYVVPPALAESMYKPNHRGISNSIGSLSVSR